MDVSVTRASGGGPKTPSTSRLKVTHRRPHERATHLTQTQPSQTLVGIRDKIVPASRSIRAKMPFGKMQGPINSAALALAAGVSHHGARENVLTSVNYGHVAHMNAADHGKSHRTIAVGYCPPRRHTPVPPPCHRIAAATAAATPSYSHGGLMIAHHAVEPPLGMLLLRHPRPRRLSPLPSMLPSSRRGGIRFDSRMPLSLLLFLCLSFSHPYPSFP